MTRSPTPTVIVLDDDEAIREALESLLRSVGLNVALYASVADFMDAKRPEGPNCLILDVRMPGKSGLDVQKELADAGLHIPIIFITGHGDIPMTVRAMKAGAVEFLAKPFRDQDLLDAISAALAQDRDRKAAESEQTALRNHFGALTPREREIMAYVVTGMLNKQIAGALAVSEITVKVHRGQVMRKMGARSVADLVRMADRLGLAPPT